MAFAAPNSMLPGDVKGKITEWNWNQLMVTNLTKNLAAKFPNLQFEGVIVNRPDYMQKLQSGLAAETDVPDIVLGEMSWRGRLLDLDILDNLEAPPYNYDRSELIPAVIPLLENQKGQIVGLDQQFCPAGFAYRRDLVKQYFGIEEPAEVAKLIADWDSFMAAGKILAKKSNGKVFMMASIQDLLTAIRGQYAQDYIKGNEIDITKRFKDVFELATRIRDSGPILDNYESDTPAWNASYSKGDVVFYNLSSWAAKTYIAGNDKENGKGRWGLVKSPGPNGFTLGGTLVGIYKESKNKQAAWAYRERFQKVGRHRVGRCPSDPAGLARLHGNRSVTAVSLAFRKELPPSPSYTPMIYQQKKFAPGPT